MATIKKTEMKTMDETKAKAKLSELRIELMKLNAQVAVGSNVESPGRIRSTKRNIAKLLTLINSKKKVYVKKNVQKENKKGVEKMQSILKPSNKLEVSTKA